MGISLVYDILVATVEVFQNCIIIALCDKILGEFSNTLGNP